MALVEEGFAQVHSSAEKTEYYKQLKSAEDLAKQKRLKTWENYQEEKEEEQIIEEEKVVSTISDIYFFIINSDDDVMINIIIKIVYK